MANGIHALTEEELKIGGHRQERCYEIDMETLRLYKQGALPKAETSLVSAHLRHCLACQQQMKTI